ncbi:transposase [Kitasatospora sp. NBC_00315]|uniref:transposase n=1 Tax=Kitasatospora sp. NBC_00315 TaxID=2975963 RepID=UPI00352F6B69
MLFGRNRYDDRVVRGGVSVKPWVVDDELWAMVEPVLPPWPERSPGPRPVPDRLCLQGVLFVLYSGITGQQLPWERGFAVRADLLAQAGAPAGRGRLRPAAPDTPVGAERGR